MRLTHPDRVLIQRPKITKADLATFYRDIADLMLPGLINRPLMLLRCPAGSRGTCFFQKHLTPGFPESVGEVIDSEDDQKWIRIGDLAGLLGLVQMNAIEYHVWGSTAADLDHADHLVFDLDPAPGMRWSNVKRAAFDVKDRLEKVNLTSYVRTTGGKGLHIVVPLRPRASWDVARSFSHALAETMAREEPERYVATASKARRAGRIFIDYLRNGRGATAVASYSLRNRTGAPVATPLLWQELSRLRSPQQFGYTNLRRRLARLSVDPWEGLGAVRQSLPRIRDE